MKFKLTPVEKHGGYLVKRDDTYAVAGVHGGKARACLHLARRAKRAGKVGLVVASARYSPQAAIVASVAKHLDLSCRVYVPKSKRLTPVLEVAKRAGADIRKGRTTFLDSAERATERYAESHTDWELIPFGMTCKEAVSHRRRQPHHLRQRLGCGRSDD